VITPAVIFAIITLAVMGPSMGRGGRHRPGEALEAGPLWIDPTDAAARARRASAARPTESVPADEGQGGVSAHW
jgi:hypothetical protein